MKHLYLLLVLTLSFCFVIQAQTDKKQDQQEQSTQKEKKKTWFQSMKKGSLEPREEKKAEVTIFGSIKGYTFNYVSCIGDPTTGKVIFTFSYSYNGLPQQTINFPAGGSAKDKKGEKFITKCEGAQKRTTTPNSVETVQFSLNHVSETITEFDIISTSVNTTSGNTVLEFRNVVINWGLQK